MTTLKARTSTESERAELSRSSVAGRSKRSSKSSRQTRTATLPVDGEYQPRITKHDCMLTLLSRSEGATIPELMDATGWQQHSIRGFLAGTVKRKLGLKLTSVKPTGELRRYRVAVKRSR